MLKLIKTLLWCTRDKRRFSIAFHSIFLKGSIHFRSFFAVLVLAHLALSILSISLFCLIRYNGIRYCGISCFGSVAIVSSLLWESLLCLSLLWHITSCKTLNGVCGSQSWLALPPSDTRRKFYHCVRLIFERRRHTTKETLVSFSAISNWFRSRHSTEYVFLKIIFRVKK